MCPLSSHMPQTPPAMESSGADKGFFQRQPVLKNQFYDDVSLQRIVKCENPWTASVSPPIPKRF